LVSIHHERKRKALPRRRQSILPEGLAGFYINCVESPVQISDERGELANVSVASGHLIEAPVGAACDAATAIIERTGPASKRTSGSEGQ